MPCRLVMGVLVDTQALLDHVVSLLEGLYGPILHTSELSLFTFTDYYDQEMGGKPYRCYLGFEKLVDPSSLSSIKRQTNALEDAYHSGGGRRVNLDPGLLSLGNLILATTKNRSHRIPLSEGIYAELTLQYERNAFHGFNWTYADYQSEEVKQLFALWRKTYHEQLKREGCLRT